MVKQKSETYPMLPTGHWWTLRDRFKQSIPGVVTSNYLATTLKMKEKSARGNVLPYLHEFMLVDEDGKTTELTKKWRDDAEYPEVCKMMLDKVYPQELKDAVPDPANDLEAVRRWFANQTGAGEDAVKKMARIYLTIAQGDVGTKPQKKAKSGAKRLGVKGNPKAMRTNPVKPLPSPGSVKQRPPTFPGVNINLEIHISSDATPDQIDKIFESMAKHIYRK